MKTQIKHELHFTLKYCAKNVFNFIFNFILRKKNYKKIELIFQNIALPNNNQLYNNMLQKNIKRIILLDIKIVS